jgi:hypothetical protein
VEGGGRASIVGMSDDERRDSGLGRLIEHDESRVESVVDGIGEASCATVALVLVEEHGGNGARPY